MSEILKDIALGIAVGAVSFVITYRLIELSAATYLEAGGWVSAGHASAAQGECRAVED